MTKKYTGSCHCGAVRFAATIDLAAGTIKCNCEMCTKSRMWSAVIAPKDFELTAGDSDLADYHPDGAHHFFCRRCGVRPFGQGQFSDGREFVAVRVSCLDGLDVDALMSGPITYIDGRNDDFESPPAETRHL